MWCSTTSLTRATNPQHNPQMMRAEKITAGPVGKGTQFRSAVASRGRTTEMMIECTSYDRPARFTTTMQHADISYTLTFEPAAGAPGCGGRGRYALRAPSGCWAR
jgi:hypothetical protein